MKLVKLFYLLILFTVIDCQSFEEQWEELIRPPEKPFETEVPEVAEIIEAVLNLDKKTLEKIFESGKNLNVKDRFGSPILFYLQTPYILHPELAKDVIKFLIKAGVDVNATDTNGNTLVSPVSSKDLKELLLELGAKSE